MRTLICCCLVLAASASELNDHRDLHRQYSDAVVALTCDAPWTNGGTMSFYGTGTIISANGLILTNTTVVPDGAWNIRVYLVDGRVLDGKQVSTDGETEGSLLRIDGQGLTHMPLGDSRRYRPADPVFAWGNAGLSIQNDGMVSLRLGALSSRYHVASLDDQSRYRGPVLESDAMINGGADGGPLTDAMGHLIGLQSLAMADNRWLGLSIPIHILRERMPELAALPLAPRSDLTGDLARRFPEHSLAQRLADRIDPAVVALAVRHSGQERPPARFPATADERDPVPADPRARARAERVPSAEGFSSGVIISANGLVLTAMGPLGDIDDIAALRVYDHTGTGWRADLLGYSELDDIALLKISAGVERFPFLELSADAEPRSGRAVVLAGRSQPPGGLSLNLGRISAVERFEERAWQMDAAVNYGNAGGAVLDLDGRLLGIAAWLEPNTPWRQNAGVGFVARSDRLAEILPRLENGEEIERKPRPFIGFRPAPFDGTGPGVLVAGVVPASPAASAGLEAGDRIVGLGGEAITGWQHLLEVLDTFEPGQQVGLSVDRDNERIDMELILGTRGGL